MMALRKKKILKDSIKKSLPVLVAFLILSFTNILIFGLYRVKFEPILYAMILEGFIGIVVFLIVLWKNSISARKREELMKSLMAHNEMPEPTSLSEEDYQAMIEILETKIREEICKNLNERSNMENYIATWVHQIKTPIATLRLYLDDFASEKTQTYATELFRIEQYVEMVLQYLRLSSETNDLVIKEQNLDEILREIVRKYAPQFVLKKIKLSFDCSEKATIVTDKKWYGCIFEQILSNAIKYTKFGGEIKITENEGIVAIEDNGIGISSEDLPLIFEKGYTGINGRSGEKSSGIGLYLAKMAADKLKIDIKVNSSIGKGSTFVVQLRDN